MSADADEFLRGRLAEHPVPSQDTEVAAPPIYWQAAAHGPHRTVRTDKNGLIAEDIACRSCGYNLRGLGVTGKCPECMAAIGRSILGDLLQFCEPAWVERLARGTTWIIAGVFAAFLQSLAAVGLGVALVATGATTGGLAPNFLAALAGMNLVVSAISMIGFWLLTSPDPAAIDTEKRTSARLIARYGLLTTVIAGPLQAFSPPGIGAATKTIGFGGAMMVLEISAIVLGLFNLIGLGALPDFGLVILPKAIEIGCHC